MPPATRILTTLEPRQSWLGLAGHPRVAGMVAHAQALAARGHSVPLAPVGSHARRAFPHRVGLLPSPGAPPAAAAQVQTVTAVAGLNGH
jgi:hypothetical protein